MNHLAAHFRSQLTVAVASLWLAMSYVGAADTPPAENKAAKENSFRVVVLLNGHALAGQFEQSGDRITVTQAPGSTVRVAIAETDFIVARWRDAYRQLRSRLRSGNMDDRLRLAQWCLRYDQVDCASDMLLEMSRLQPNHRAVKSLERQLAHRAGLVELATAENGPSDSVQLATHEAVEADTATTATSVVPNLDPASVTEFTRTIQPLLLNRCALANCHGTAKRSEFTMQRHPIGKLTHRDLTWSNLQAALRQIDTQQPEKSALLRMALSPHGTARRAPIDTHQVRQKERLRQWVMLVASEKTAPIESESESSRVGGLSALQAELDADSPAPPAADELPTGDPLDPAEFNRRFHP